ncbi:MAG TPA: glycosyltransferase family 4 protein [Dehalococcoidia bacterium]|nr:glycosyltransferase family 4 protein [Dehalococcoidia bacterium]
MRLAERGPKTQVETGTALTGLRIVMFTNSIMMGGMEAHIDALARGLVRRGVSVAVICPDDEIVAPLRRSLLTAGVEVFGLPSRRRSPLGLLQRWLSLVRLFRSLSPFVLHLHITGSDGGGLPMLAAKIAGAGALIRTEHQPPDYPVSFRKRLMIRLRDHGLDRIVCVSRTNMEQHIQDLRRRGGKFDFVYNAVDLGHFDPGRADGTPVRKLITAGESDIVIGTLGRLAEPRKGSEYFVDMARMLARENGRFRFIMIGEGPRRQALEERAGEDVEFMGFYPDAAECYAAFDIFVMPSLWEGGPITVLEAAAMARPIVSTDVGMVSEVIEQGITGLVVPPGDTEALAAAVRTLAADVEKACEMGRRARETILRDFGEDVMIDRMLGIYEGLQRAGGNLG